MKFWQKAYICVIIFFLAAFDITAFFIVEKSDELNRSNETATAENEFYIIQKSLSDRILSISEYYTELNAQNIRQYVEPYAEYYESQNISMEIYIEDTLCFSNFNKDISLNTDSNATRKAPLIQLKHIDEKPYLIISNFLNIPNANIKFIYIKDETSLDLYRNRIASYAVKTSTVISIVLSVLLIAMLLGLTHPIRKLNKGAKEIAKGNYKQRVAIKSNDEIGEFASHFNIMAAHVEEHIQNLTKVSHEQQRFIDNFSHEMRTPTAAIIGYGELLKNADLDGEERLKAINYIINQGTRLQKLSSKLLRLSSIKHSSYDMKQVSLTEIINNVQNSLRSFYEPKEIGIQLNLTCDNVIGDADLLESLFQNILENAIRVLPKKGIIAVASKSTDSGVCVIIADNGPGIASENLPFIEEPFYRVDKARTRKHGGAGLGLSICKEICNVHHAKIEFLSIKDESEEFQSGTKIKIYFTNS